MDLVPDVVFLILFPVPGFLVLLWAIRRSRRIATAWPPPDRVRFLDVTRQAGEEIGYLAGGERRAIEAAVARLRVADVVTYDRDTGALVPTGRELPARSHPLAAAVLAAAPHRIPVGLLRHHGRVAAELRELGYRVRGIWWVHDVPPRHFVSAGLPVVAFGLAGLIWALVPPFRWFTDVPLFLMALVAVLAGLVLCGRPDGMERVATRELRRVKEANAHLDPGMRPALSTYGPAAAALAVGLYGLSVLGSTDPEIAALSFEAAASATGEASRVAASGGGSGADPVGDVADTASSVADLSSCGGGGCGGGCGGCGG